LILPIRCGYLEAIDSRSPYKEGALVEQSVDHVAEVIREIDAGPLPVVGHSFGSLVALRLAAAHPSLVSRLDLFSINLGKPDDDNRGFIGRLFAGLRKLVSTPGIFRVIATHYRRAYADEPTVRDVLNKMFSASESDLAYLDARDGRGGLITWFSELYQNSILGICEDFYHVVTAEPEELSITCPTSFHHGSEDGLASIESVRELAMTMPIADIKPYDAGHLLCATVPVESLVAGLADSQFELVGVVNAPAKTNVSSRQGEPVEIET
ncbi:MAG: alpha/beta hydrolase, partial [Novosphingobium sp.]|nr:alpha/beta hydrolase [Novosphingobium sp.]